MGERQTEKATAMEYIKILERSLARNYLKPKHFNQFLPCLKQKNHSHSSQAHPQPYNEHSKQRSAEDSIHSAGSHKHSLELIFIP